MATINRIIHPVGQGAFYSECLNLKDDIYIVYDCGSKNKKYLEQEINSFAPKGATIDILFISHFDSDHINGIKFLKNKYHIKNVIIPLINSDDTWIYILDNIVNGNSDGINLIRDTQGYFSNQEQTRVIRVKPINYEGVDNNRESLNIDNLSSDINSNQKILVGPNKWCYIPFNYDEKNRRDLLKKELGTETVRDLTNITAKDIERFLKDNPNIKKTYKKVCHGLNNSSLIVYSGLKSSHTNNLEPCKTLYPRCYHRLLCYIFPCLCMPYYRSACLYLGDTDMNQSAIIKQIKNKLGDLNNNIGTIQLPHHGSINNFNKDILTFNADKCKCYFASFGNLNSYGHPSSDVIRKIFDEGCFFYGITEKRDSILIQEIHIE